MCCDDEIDPNDVLMAAPVAPDPGATCRWDRQRDGSWATQCSGTYRLADGADLDAIHFCPYCGQRVRKPRVPHRPGELSGGRRVRV